MKLPFTLNISVTEPTDSVRILCIIQRLACCTEDVQTVALLRVDTSLFLTACLCVVVADFKECFSLYDRQRKGKIDAQELITVMRCLGLNPTPAEVQRHLLSHNIGISPTRLSAAVLGFSK